MDAKVELKPEEYQAVEKSIAEAQVQEPVLKKRKVAVQKDVTPVDPAIKELKDANVKKAASLRNLKKKTDSLKTEMAKTIVLIPCILAKGYPQSMVDFLIAECNMVLTDVTTSTTMYAEHVLMKEEEDTANVSKVKGHTSTVEIEMQRLVTRKHKFDKGKGADIKKLCATCDAGGSA